MGCADPPSMVGGAPHQCSRVNEQRSGWGGVVTGQRHEPRSVFRNSRVAIQARRGYMVNLPARQPVQHGHKLAIRNGWVFST